MNAFIVSLSSVSEYKDIVVSLEENVVRFFNCEKLSTKKQGAEVGAQVLKKIGDVFRVVDIDNEINSKEPGYTRVIITAEKGLFYGSYSTE